MQCVKYVIVLVLLALCQLSNVYALDKIGKVTQTELNKYKSEITSSIDKLNNDVKEIRRDQLNYKIEKDLLKETYSTNLQTINVIITILVAVFGFIGYVGLKDISALQKAYKEELENLNKVKNDMTNEIRCITDEQKQAKDSFDKITKTIEEQNIKIKVLELRDKITSLFKEGKYSNALEYCAIALEMDSDNILINNMKANCYFKLSQYDNAIKTFKKTIEIDEANLTAKANLCELYLIRHNIQAYESIFTDIRQELFDRHNGHIDVYFEVFKSYIENDLVKIKFKLSEYLATTESGSHKRTKWDFTDLDKYMKKQPESECKGMIICLIQFLNGEKDRDEFMAMLK